MHDSTEPGRSFQAILLSLWTLASATACRAPFGLERDWDAPVQTRALEYTLTPKFGQVELNLTFEFTNASDRRVFVANCETQDIRLERHAEDGWRQVQSEAAAGCSGVTEVASGGSWRGKLRFRAGHPDCNCVPMFAGGIVDGDFRIVLDDIYSEYVPGTRPSLSARLPLEQRGSNRFRLRLP